MRAELIRIGNSRGIRIPKKLLDHYHFEQGVDLEPRNGHLVIRAAGRPREGWEDAFRRMAERGDDRLLDKSVSTRWDRQEWEW